MSKKLYIVCNVSDDNTKVVIRNDYTPLYDYLIRSHGKKWTDIYDYVIASIDKPLEIMKIVKNINLKGEVFAYPELDDSSSMVRLNGIFIAKYVMIKPDEYWSTMYVDEDSNLMLIDKNYEVKNPWPNKQHRIRFNGQYI